jgi:rhodanese-related sulfurtransferase
MTAASIDTAPIDVVLTRARTRLDRLTPREAWDAASRGALLVDIRPEINRRVEGAIPGALVIDRNVLEWRLDPASDARIPQASYDAWVVLFCNEGYASSLAAVSLQDLGISAATDMIGGFRAWQAAGLPVVAPLPLRDASTGITDEADAVPSR